jgi:3-deoxy-7-phosphoheptulonate synthase
MAAARAVGEEGLCRGVVVDCSHGNSDKDPTRQGAVLGEVVGNFAAGHNAILGVMLESNLRPGRQTWMQGAPLEYGVSITDGCIGFEETERLLLDAADLLSRPAAARAVG